MTSWRKDYVCYPEIILDDQLDGTCVWTARLYNYEGPCYVQYSETGVGHTKADAKKASRDWVAKTLDEECKRPEPKELQVITSTDVGVLDASELLGE